MTDTFRCFVHGIPKPKGSKRAFVVKGRAVLTESKEVKSWEYLLMESLGVAMDEGDSAYVAEDCPWDGPVEVTLQFHLSRPKSAKKRGWPHVRPDVDKLCRTVLDALVGAAVLKDDAQVVSLVAEKVYADVPGVSVEVRKL